MTRDQFIEGYIRNSAFRNIVRTENGFSIAGATYVALPCACDYEECRGWAKVRDTPEDIETHVALYGPREPT